jgi:hypothetical protein
MKKYLLLPLLLASSVFCGGKAHDNAEEVTAEINEAMYNSYCKASESKDESFAYFGVHVHPIPLPLPGVDFGYRFKFNGVAIDASIKYTTAFIANGIQGDLSFLKYMDDSFYMGIGMRNAYVFTVDDHLGVVGLNFLAGFEFKRENKSPSFVQLELFYPNYIYSHDILSFIPGVNVKYGWGF